MVCSHTSTYTTSSSISNQTPKDVFDIHMYNNNEYLIKMAYYINLMNEKHNNPHPYLQNKWQMYFDKIDNKWMSEYLEAGTFSKK